MKKRTIILFICSIFICLGIIFKSETVYLYDLVKIIIKDANQENHIILCDIKYNKDDIKKINIDNRVNYLVSKIEQDFVEIKKEEYKFKKYD